VPARAGDRAGPDPTFLGQFEEHVPVAGGGVDLQYPWLRLDFVAALDDVAVASIVEAAVHRLVETGGDDVDGVPFWHQHILRPVSPWAAAVEVDPLRERRQGCVHCG
jgi:hypothetical protein